MNLPPLDLSLQTHQEFSLEIYKQGVQQATKQELEEMVLSLIRQNLVKDSVIKQLTRAIQSYE